MRNIGFTISLLFMTMGLFAQNITLRGTIPGLAGDDVYLVQSFAGPQKVVDTARVNPMGTFTFTMQGRPVGMYQVLTNTGMAVRLLYNDRPVDFKTSSFQQGAKVNIISSAENKIFYQYQNVEESSSDKLKLLKPVVEFYPPSDPFYQTVKSKAEHLQNEIQQTATRLVTKYPRTMAAKFIQLDRPVAVPLNLTTDEQTRLLKKEYFKYVNFKDTLILRSDLFTKKIVGYLALYQQPGMTKQDVEEAFMPAVDTLLAKSIVNEKVYLFTLKYLMGGFDEFGFQKLLLHIAKHSKLSSLPGHSALKSALQEKIYETIHLAPGQPAPDFKARTLNGQELHLYDVQAKNTLLIFWASWCPHCTASLPGLEKYYNPRDTQKLQVVAVSIDTDKKAVEKAVKDEGYQWPVIAQLKGWDSPIAETYNVSATPTFFLLDQNKRIVLKTTDVKTLESFLNH
ncbi:MAG: redoxin domain-containing protein [Bacteroidales bacterium]|nr:redoxin domain-containing protein [Bacteroidales bacterium]